MARESSVKNLSEKELEETLNKVRNEKYERAKETPVNKSISELLNAQIAFRQSRKTSVSREIEREVNKRLGSNFNRPGSSPINPKVI